MAFRKMVTRKFKWERFIAPVASFIYYATHFDGASDIERSGNWSPAPSNGKTGMISFWYKTTQTSGTYNMFQNSGGDLLLKVIGSDNLRLQIYDAPDTTLSLEMQTLSGIIRDGNWHHYIVTWDVANAANCKWYVDGVDDGFVAVRIDAALGYNYPYWYFVNATVGIVGDISEFYFAPNQWLDLTVPANVQKFRTTGGKPVDLGSNGSTPTGTAPLVYLHNQYSSFGTNSGTGGDFGTVIGTLTNATPP